MVARMVATSPGAHDAPEVITFRPRGSGAALFGDRSAELLLAGPAGTGKSRSCLELTHLRAAKYPGSRHLIVRKTLQSLKSSTLVTFDERVQPQRDGVIFKGDTAKRPAHYLYPNGSVLVIGGMDKAIKVMSSEYDSVYCPEATEFSEHDWEALTTRLRNGRMPYQQLLGDCNPDAPTHFLRKRADGGKLRMLESRHEDNPVLWDDAAQCWTPEGDRYLATLDRLTGVRYLRLRKGFWAAAEGMVYQDAWDTAKNVSERREVEVRNARTGRPELPRTWPRYLSIDFGFNHPFVCQWWAQDPDGRLYLYREIYMSNRLVQTHAGDILNAAGWAVTGGRLSQARADGDPLPYLVIADPEDAEGRAQLARYLGCAITPAHKEVRQGIQAVAARLRVSGDGKPRLLLLRDSLVETDPLLIERKAPTCTAEEVESYVWRRGPDGQPLEEPLKQHDDGLDCMRYLVSQVDLHPMGVDYGPNIWS